MVSPETGTLTGERETSEISEHTGEELNTGRCHVCKSVHTLTLE